MHIFIEIGLILAIATLLSLLMRFLRQPLMVGYILTGIIAGPYVLDLIKYPEYVELFSKLGIAMLLFIVGLSLRPDVVREVGKVSLITGLGQVIFTSVIGFGLMKLLGFGTSASFYGAIALTFSSTIIILKLLSDKGDVGALYGKISVGFLLVQDIVATIILLLVSFFGSPSDRSSGEILLTFGMGVLFFIILYGMGRYVLPSLSLFLAKSQEALFLFSVTWGLGIAAVFYNFGFSLEIGALIAGVALSVSPFSEEIASRMKPLRDFFILLFFVLLGSQIVLSSLGSILIPAIILSLFVLIGNPIIVIILMNLLGYRSRTGFMAGLTVAQISEFSLILMALAFSYGHVSQEAVSVVTLVGIATILGSTYLILYADKLYHRLEKFIKIFEWRKRITEPEETTREIYDMIIFGYDRVGYDFVKTALNLGKKYLVVDFDPTAVEKMKKAGIVHRFGDAEDVVFLEDINLAKAEMVISTIPDARSNLRLITYYHNHKPDGLIISTARDIRTAEELYAHGASFVVMPYYLGAKHAAGMIEAFGSDLEAFREEMTRHLAYLKERSVHTR